MLLALRRTPKDGVSVIYRHASIHPSDETEWAGDSRWPWMIVLRPQQHPNEGSGRSPPKTSQSRRYSSAELVCNFVLRRACLHQFRRDEFEADQHECIEAFGEFLVLCWYRMGCDGDAMLPEWRTAWKRSVKAASQAFQAHWLDRCDVKPQIFWPCTKNYPISMSMDSTRSLDFAFQSPKSLAKWFLISKSTFPSHEMHWILMGDCHETRQFVWHGLTASYEIIWRYLYKLSNAAFAVTNWVSKVAAPTWGVLITFRLS